MSLIVGLAARSGDRRPALTSAVALPPSTIGRPGSEIRLDRAPP